MRKSFSSGLAVLVMSTNDIMKEYPRAKSVTELDEMLLKVCHEANNEDISDAEFRSMIHNLMLKKIELMEDRMPAVRIG